MMEMECCSPIKKSLTPALFFDRTDMIHLHNRCALCRITDTETCPSGVKQNEPWSLSPNTQLSDFFLSFSKPHFQSSTQYSNSRNNRDGTKSTLGSDNKSRFLHETRLNSTARTCCGGLSMYSGDTTDNCQQVRGCSWARCTAWVSHGRWYSASSFACRLASLSSSQPLLNAAAKRSKQRHRFSEELPGPRLLSMSQLSNLPPHCVRPCPNFTITRMVSLRSE